MMRIATAASIVLFVSSLLGTGGAPFIIGVASDLMEPTFGKDSLRYALLLTCGMLVWSVFHFIKSARAGKQPGAELAAAT